MKKLVCSRLKPLEDKAKKYLHTFWEDERGVSPIVATVLIILISVVLAVFVSDGLKSWVANLFEQFRSNTSNIK